ncbi:MAG: NAD(P)-dependent alcohol dehydrogenase, partial [Acidobacteria bacterium]
MKAWQLERFGIEGLALRDVPVPHPGPGQVRVRIEAISLNYRDLLVVRGQYNPHFALPAVPVSDGAGTVTAVGDGVEDVAVGDRVMTHFIADWQDGRFEERYLGGTLGLPGPGVAAEEVVLAAHAIVPVPDGWSSEQAATLPIAALTAWCGLLEDGGLEPGGTALCLGTGGVSVFGVQIAAALGARPIVTSSSDAKLARARELGAEFGINYATNPEWDTAVLEATGGLGADVTLEIGGAGTLERSIRATRAGGTISVIGVLAGVETKLSTVTFMMRRQRLQGILVG